MRLHIASIGNGRNQPEHALALGWFERLQQQGTWREYVSKKPAGIERMRDESRHILAAIPAGGVLIALDGSGVDTSSEDMAEIIRRLRDKGCRDAVFAIGGADGHDKSLLAQATQVIAFGRQTWPHMLVRPMLAEQLYRAEMILAGHPYHHGKQRQ